MRETDLMMRLIFAVIICLILILVKVFFTERKLSKII